MNFVTLFDPKKQINFASYFKLAGFLAIILSLSSIIGFFAFDLNWGIDFSGGMEMQVKFDKEVQVSQIRKILNDLGYDKNQVQQFGASENNEMLIKVERALVMQATDVERYKAILNEKFPRKLEHKENIPSMVYDEKSGNQAFIWLEQPYEENEENFDVIKSSLETQKSELLALLSEKGQVELRKSKKSIEAKAEIADSLQADQPKDGFVKYTVHFAGVAEKIQKALEEKIGNTDIRRVDFVDSQVSKQLKSDGILAIIYALLAILIYIAIRFDIYFAPGAIIALIHDLFVAMLVFVVGRIEFDTPSIAALLTIVGYSINNTVVIYDRIRETMPTKNKNMSMEDLKNHVNKAINDTMARSVNSTITTLMASISVWIFTTGVIQRFSIVLTVGIAFGAITSIFISPSFYLLAKKYFQKPENIDIENSGISREDKAKGIV